jgi:integrase
VITGSIKKKQRATGWPTQKKHIKIINSLLEDGAHINVRVKPIQDVSLFTQQDRNYTITEAFSFIMPLVKAGKREDTYSQYFSIQRMFIDFCKLAGWDEWKIRTLKQQDIAGWLDFLQVDRKISNLTRNNYLGFISGMFTLMVDRHILTTNPALGIKQAKVDENGGNIAYTPDDIAKLKEAILATNPRLWLYVTFLLYGFMRPKEIGRLRVNMIDLEGNYIHLPGASAKITLIGR